MRARHWIKMTALDVSLLQVVKKRLLQVQTLVKCPTKTFRNVTRR